MANDRTENLENGEAEVEHYGLKFGDGSDQSLDQPGTCVITTYGTLRDLRFSFAACNWACVILDEAQNIKEPQRTADDRCKISQSLLPYWAIGNTRREPSRRSVESQKMGEKVLLFAVQKKFQRMLSSHLGLI